MVFERVVPPGGRSCVKIALMKFSSGGAVSIGGFFALILDSLRVKVVCFRLSIEFSLPGSCFLWFVCCFSGF